MHVRKSCTLPSPQFATLFLYEHGSVKKCDVDYSTNLLNNVVVTGGVTLTQGFVERLTNELSNLTFAVCVLASLGVRAVNVCVPCSFIVICVGRRGMSAEARKTVGRNRRVF